MSESKIASSAPLATAPEMDQEVELAALVEMEARWENLRTNPARLPGVRLTTQGLQERQRVYEAFRERLTAYNRLYDPAHVPELLLNNSARLAKWCRAMRNLYLRVEQDGRVRCPVHLLQKAYRWADVVAGRQGKAPISRSTPPAAIRFAILDLETLCVWCEGVAGDPVTEVPYPTAISQ